MPRGRARGTRGRGPGLPALARSGYGRNRLFVRTVAVQGRQRTGRSGSAARPGPGGGTGSTRTGGSMKRVIRREATTPAEQRREARERAARAARAAVRGAAFSGLSVVAELRPGGTGPDGPPVRRPAPPPALTPAANPRVPRQREP